MKMASQKTLIVFDSQIKRASFMSWMAADVKSDPRSVYFRKFGESDDKIVEYNDFKHAGITQRCVAVTVDALVEPLLIPIIFGAKTVVFLITRRDSSNTGCIDKLSVAHRAMLRQGPQVFLLFSDGGREQALVMESQLKAIGITPNYPELHTNDFRAIFDIMIDGDTHNEKNEGGAAPKVQAATVNKPIKGVKSPALDADHQVTQPAQEKLPQLGPPKMQKAKFQRRKNTLYPYQQRPYQNQP